MDKIIFSLWTCRCYFVITHAYFVITYVYLQMLEIGLLDLDVWVDKQRGGMIELVINDFQEKI